MSLTKKTVFVFVLVLGAVSAAAQDSPAKLWQELDQMLPRHGQAGPISVPSAAIDWQAQVAKAEEFMVRSGATPVEPFSMYYLANFLFESGRLDEALAIFETIRSQFPEHPLVKLQTSKDQKPLVLQAIEDCASEIAWRARYPRPPLPVPALDPKTTVVLHTSAGDVKLQFYRNVAPKHVENFLKHATAGDYDGTKVSQIIQESVVNLGDPATKGKEPSRDPMNMGPSQPHEFSNLSHVRGAVAMARHMGGTESAMMAFQILLKEQPYFDFTQTIFARVVEGIEVIDAISRMPRDQFQKPSPEVLLKNVTVTQQ